MNHWDEDEKWMQYALQEAQRAYKEEEVPIGAVIVLKNRIIARGYNQTERLNDCTAHAEMIALTSAFHYLGSKYLPEARLYVTVEPCLMCAGALYWSKIRQVIYGVRDEKNGYKKTTGSTSPFHPRTKLIAGVLEADCQQLMQQFFRDRRSR